MMHDKWDYGAGLKSSTCQLSPIFPRPQIESKVREATNDDEWGPHGGLMQEVAQYTYQYEHFPEVMGMLWRR